MDLLVHSLSQVASHRTRRPGEPNLLVGNEILGAELSRLNVRSPFDENVLCNFEVTVISMVHFLKIFLCSL